MESPPPPSSAREQQQKNKQVAREFFELLDRHDFEKMGKLVSSINYSLHFPGTPPLDWNGHKQLLAAITSAFPDLHHDIEDLVTEGDEVAVRSTVTATQKGEFQGIPATGKKVSLEEMDFLTIVDGKITEGWVSVDMLGLMQQIGMIPTSNTQSASESGLEPRT
jgi:steroid delta-isomerase-like uncharacterized protein